MMFLKRKLTQYFVNIIRDEDGGPLVETTVLLPILLIFLLGAIDFGFLFHQWSVGSKAVQVGARIAAVSDPVASGLNDLSMSVVDASTVFPGDPMPSFTITCNGYTSSCACVGAACSGTFNYDLTAMQKIVYGRAGGSSCGTPSSSYFTGMCNLFSAITPAHVQVVYAQTGLGYAGREEGPQPTISVSLLQDPDAAALKFQFFFLGQLLSFGNLKIPPFTTTMTGEALSAAAVP